MPRPERPILQGGEKLCEQIKRASGFGDKWHPQTLPEARTVLVPQLREVRELASNVPEDRRGANIVFQATIFPNYLANSYFPKRLLELAGVHSIGARTVTGTYMTATAPEPKERPTKSLLLTGSPDSIRNLSQLLESESLPKDLQGAAQSFVQFEQFYMSPREEVLRDFPADDEDFPSLWEAVLHPTVAPDTDEMMYAKWTALVRSLNGEVVTSHRRSAQGLTFVPVRLSRDAVESCTGFNGLRVLRPAPRLNRPSRFRRYTESGELSAPDGQQARSTNRVAVFDGGIKRDCPILAPFVNQIDLTPEPEDDEATDHGTAVTSTVLWGAATRGQLTVPEVTVDHYRIEPYPNEEHDTEAYWVLDRIEEVVRASNYPLVNLSWGPPKAITDDEPHSWTSTIDMLAEETGTLFVIAVGNNGMEPHPHSRIQTPSDAVNVIGVGACDFPSPQEPWARSLYSAFGPGRSGGRLRPSGVAFGGSDANPYPCHVGHGQLAHDAGTSFATPLVVHGMSSLLASVPEGRFDANALRALAVHFAEPTQDDHAVEEIGHGRFQADYSNALDCAQNRVTVLYEDDLSRDETVKLPIPLPVDGLSPGTQLSVTWTVAFTSPVDALAPLDYTLRGLQIDFRPHSRVFLIHHPQDAFQAQKVNLDTHAALATELIGAGGQLSLLPVTQPFARIKSSEQLLRDEGKWETLIHANRGFQFGSLHEPMLTMSFLARKDGELIRGEAVPPLAYTMAVSVGTRRGDINLYDAVRTRYDILTPVQTEIVVRAAT